MKFKNSANGYIEEVSSLTWLWALLFGSFYFVYKQLWGTALISLVFAVFTMGLSWLIYPFFAANMVRKSYLRKGWIELDEEQGSHFSPQGNRLS